MRPWFRIESYITGVAHCNGGNNAQFGHVVGLVSSLLLDVLDDVEVGVCPVRCPVIREKLDELRVGVRGDLKVISTNAMEDDVGHATAGRRRLYHGNQFFPGHITWHGEGCEATGKSFFSAFDGDQKIFDMRNVISVTGHDVSTGQSHGSLALAIDRL